MLDAVRLRLEKEGKKYGAGRGWAKKGKKLSLFLGPPAGVLSRRQSTGQEGPGPPLGPAVTSCPGLEAVDLSLLAHKKAHE